MILEERQMVPVCADSMTDSERIDRREKRRKQDPRRERRPISYTELEGRLASRGTTKNRDKE